MKKKFKIPLTIVAAILRILCANAQTYTLSFDINDYEIISQINGKYFIRCKSGKDTYKEAPAPCLPITTKRFLMPSQADLSDFTIEESECQLVQENIILESNPSIVPTNDILTEENSSADLEYDEIVYPSCNVDFQTTLIWQGLPMACFDVTPFKYDASTKKLYFINHFNINLNLKSGSPKHSRRIDRIEEVTDVAKEMVENPEDIEDVLMQTPESISEYLEKIEYLLITSSDLEPTFRKLVNWKKSKGVYANIVTLDQIQSWYNYGQDMQEHIKHCLYDAFYSYGLKYVVLGGDDTIVPKRSCYTKCDSYISTDTPADKYYVCFDGDFYWDGNGNSIYGEIDDNIDLTESAYISRIPVRTIEEAEIFVDKLISYEKGEISEN